MLQFAGNAALVARLNKAIAADSLAHFYIISGPVGSGRKTLAALLASAMECTGDNRPCKKCGQCHKVLGNIHPDVSYITSDKQSVGVELIRQMRQDAYIRPTEGKRRIFVIPKADTLTEQAQNVMLKLLEEPPGTSSFILITENPGSLLQTVRSRAVELPLSALSPDEIKAWLKARYPNKVAFDLDHAAAASGGLPGKAIELLGDEEASPLASEKSIEAVALLKKSDKLGLAVLFASLERTPKPDFDAFLAALLSAATTEAAQCAGSGKLAGRFLSAAENTQTAIEFFKSNVNTPHICGFLAASLTEGL